MYELFGGETLLRWQKIWWCESKPTEIMITHNLTTLPTQLRDVAQFDVISNDGTFPEKEELPLSLLNWKYGSGNGCVNNQDKYFQDGWK